MRTSTYFIVCLCFWAFSNSIVKELKASEQKLIYAISPENKHVFADTYYRLLNAFDASGYQVTVLELPSKRSYQSLIKGEVAMEARLDSKLFDNAEVIKISVPIVDIELAMVASKETPEKCNYSENQYSEMTFASVRGSYIFEKVYGPLFKKQIEVDDYFTLLRMVVSKRADYTAIDLKTIDRLPRELMDKLVICEGKRHIVQAHVYLHKSYKWALPKLEAALKKEFAN